MLAPPTAARPALRLAHVALWTRDVERLSRFYGEALGAEIGPRYTNPRTGLVTYCARFEGASVELMARPDVVARGAGETASAPSEGYAHLALALGSRGAVDALIARLREGGVPILGAPRQTGDGYYEAVIADPDGNPVEIVA
jgi:lactoylglutathione lyase